MARVLDSVSSDQEISASGKPETFINEQHCANCRRYEKAQKPLSQFLSDINRYKDLIEEVLSENSQETVKFLYVDCSPLKQVCSLSMIQCSGRTSGRANEGNETCFCF